MIFKRFCWGGGELRASRMQLVYYAVNEQVRKMISQKKQC